MRVGIHRVDAPSVAGVVVLGMLDAVERRIAHVDVRARHVEPGAQHGGPIEQGAGAHLAEAGKVFGGRAIAKSTVCAGVSEVTAVRSHLVGTLLVDVGQARIDQRFRGAVHEIEIVAGVVEMADAVRLPVEPQPLDGVEDAVDILLLFLLRVGVVEAQVADAAVLGREPEVQRDAFRMTDVQIAVRLGREAGADPGRIGGASGVVRGVAGSSGEASLGIGAVRQVTLDDLPKKVAARILGSGTGIDRFGHGLGVQQSEAGS